MFTVPRLPPKVLTDVVDVGDTIFDFHREYKLTDFPHSGDVILQSLENVKTILWTKKIWDFLATKISMDAILPVITWPETVRQLKKPRVIVCCTTVQSEDTGGIDASIAACLNLQGELEDAGIGAITLPILNTNPYTRNPLASTIPIESATIVESAIIPSAVTTNWIGGQILYLCGMGFTTHVISGSDPADVAGRAALKSNYNAFKEVYERLGIFELSELDDPFYSDVEEYDSGGISTFIADFDEYLATSTPIAEEAIRDFFDL